MTKTERLKCDGYEGIEPVLFYHPGDEWGCFSNFSDHPVRLRNPWTNQIIKYQTSEHRYQAMKAVEDFEHEDVWDSPSPGISKQRGREVALREDWGDSRGDICWYVMLEVLIAKAIQHDYVLTSLSATGERPIYEDSPVDDIWGWRFHSNYTGKNLLGLGWMHVRDILFP